MQEFKYQFKILIRNRIMLFWTFLFPLILATFFNLAFSNLTSSEGFDIVKVAVVEQQSNEDFKTLLDSLSTKGEDQLLDVQYVSLEEAKELLEEDDISGYLTINDEIEITVSETGINQTIIQTIVNNYYQVSSTLTNIAELNPSAFATGVLDDLQLDKNNFNEISNENVDLTVIYFYTLIGMNCMYGGFWGLLVTTNIEANLSRQGTRVTMAPTSKFKVLGTGIIAAFLCQFASMLILLGYLTLGLGISFGNQIGLIMLLMAVGSFVGIAMGTLIGNALKVKLDTKITINTMISMACSFFAGMMVIDIKYFLQENFPIATYINPVSLITDALYALYYYTTNDRYFFNIFCLLAIGVVISVISLFMMRKKKYDSI
ncbi:MAG: ABC transporter permease [Coprobacillaceae bacterium]